MLEAANARAFSTFSSQVSVSQSSKWLPCPTSVAFRSRRGELAQRGRDQDSAGAVEMQLFGIADHHAFPPTRVLVRIGKRVDSCADRLERRARIKEEAAVGMGGQKNSSRRQPRAHREGAWGSRAVLWDQGLTRSLPETPAPLRTGGLGAGKPFFPTDSHSFPLYSKIRRGSRQISQFF